MGKTILAPTQKATLRTSSRQAARTNFERLHTHFGHHRWLGSSNRYGKNCVQKIFTDLKPGGNVNSRHLAQYIVASAPLHCSDGWGYLGRALDSHAKGDTNTARHLAYYAELRGAMALLAAEGIGIFSGRHFVIDSNNTCHLIPKSKGSNNNYKWSGTHEIAWLVLDHWADLSRSANLILEIISPGGVRLDEWLTAFGAGASARIITNKRLKSWGLDLKHLSDDRDARNEASYRPTRLHTYPPSGVLNTSAFLRHVWSILEPSPAARFEKLDRHLLRLTLEQTYKAVTGNNASADPTGFEKRVVKMIEAIAPRGSSEEEWRNFLTSAIDADLPILLSEASGNAPVNSPQHHMQVISRATLLLRVATGACDWLLREAGVKAKDLEFWWSSYGEELGLWDTGAAPDELTDLWADVENALNEVRTWEDANAGTGASLASWWRDRSYSISLLGGCERVGLWGLGL